MLTFEEFEARAQARGFDEVVARSWRPHEVLAEHEHPFALEAQVIEGEMWLTVGGQVRHLGPGECFTLDHGMPHAERYGEAGATYWVARRLHPDARE